jgi:hypothetical protein
VLGASLAHGAAGRSGCAVVLLPWRDYMTNQHKWRGPSSALNLRRRIDTIRFMRGAAVLLVLVQAGCASVGVTRVKTAPPKSPECLLDVYTSETEIKKPFEILCLLDARSGTTLFADKTMAGAVNAARPEACGCGADGILIVGGTTEGIGAFSWGQGTAMIKALRYIAETASAPPTAIAPVASSVTAPAR